MYFYGKETFKSLGLKFKGGLRNSGKDCCASVGVIVLKHAALCLTPACLPSCQTIESNWRCGRHNLQRIQCRSENSKGVYCLQYDDEKIISGLRDNSIKVNAFSVFSVDTFG